jgi:hypothetical protein
LFKKIFRQKGIVNKLLRLLIVVRETERAKFPLTIFVIIFEPVPEGHKLSSNKPKTVSLLYPIIHPKAKAMVGKRNN